MPDDKTTKVPETAAPDTGPGKPPEQAPVKEPAKTEPPTPEQKPPEQAADKAAPPKDKEAPTSEKAGAEKSPNVSVYNFSEIMAEKKAAEKEKTPEKAAPAPDKGKEPEKPDKAVKKEPDKTAESPKRRGRPPKETQAKTPADKKKTAPAKEPAAPKKTSIWKEALDKATGNKEKAPKAPATKKAADKGSAAVKPPAPEQPKPQEPPKEAPRRGEEQIVYIKLDELHAFKNHPFQVRDDDEMRAMVSSVKDKGVTQPASLVRLILGNLVEHAVSVIVNSIGVGSLELCKHLLFLGNAVKIDLDALPRMSSNTEICRKPPGTRRAPLAAAFSRSPGAFLSATVGKAAITRPCACGSPPSSGAAPARHPRRCPRQPRQKWGPPRPC